MRTAKEIMNAAYKAALEIVHDNAPQGTDAGSATIAGSNLAIAIFSYEVEMEQMKDSHRQVDDGVDLGDDQNG
jgi:hypothetical protein